jgi:hypothetical protein
MLNSYSFVETDAVSVVNEGFSHLRYNFGVSDRILIEALIQIQYNHEQRLRTRLLLGSGLRFELLRARDGLLAIGFTGLYEYEELESGKVIKILRNSDYIACRVKRNDHISVSNTLYVQPAFNDSKDVHILNELTLSVELAEWLAMTLEVHYLFDSEPPEGVKQYDLSLKNGLIVSF